MTYRSASSKWSSYCKLLGITGVLTASLAVGVASGQQERTSRSSDRSSEQDESTRRRDESSQADESSRSSRNQSDQRRRTGSQTSDQERTTQDRSSQTRTQQGTQFGERSQSGQSNQNQSNQNQYGQGRSSQDQYGQQNRFGQGQSAQGQQGRYAQARDDRQSIRDEEYRSQRGGQQSGQQSSGQGDSAWLGVYLSERQTNENGVQITQVYPAGPAARAGLRSGDVVTAVDGNRVRTAEELIEAIDEHEPGGRAQLSLTRNNQQVELPITLGSRQSYAWTRPDQQWSGQQDFGGGYATSSRSGNEEFRSGHSDEEDYWSNVPPFAMQLEHERRMYEQHQRIETQIAKLQEEVRQLREELRQQRR